MSLRIVGAVLVAGVVIALARAGEPESTEQEESMSSSTEIAVFGGGCFWCLEAVYEKVRGVKEVVNGYAGGETDEPTYEQVCSGTTGHAEVVQIRYDPAEIRYPDLLEVFWAIHDPTTRNRQGADVGSQYRSIILYRDEAQREAARQSMEAVARELERPVVTELEPLRTFHRAEDHHQDYFENHPNQPYCAFVVSPKVRKFQEEFEHLQR